MLLLYWYALDYFAFSLLHLSPVGFAELIGVCRIMKLSCGYIVCRVSLTLDRNSLLLLFLALSSASGVEIAV